MLQSIGRGDKEGVLYLDAGDLQARLGMRDGMIFPLPAPNEEEDLWRRRCQNAWAEDPQPALEAQRRDTIARAARIESLYELLEAPNVHFRFVTGSIASWTPPSPQIGGPAGGDPTLVNLDEASKAPAKEENPWEPGIPVEYLLLEHARLSDENRSSAAAHLRSYDVVRALDASMRSDEEQRLLRHCDGRSTLCEVADRMGWTLTQTLAAVSDFFEQGVVRQAHPQEMLVLAQHELQQKRAERSAARLTGWVRRSVTGPPGSGDLECLVTEWREGRLGTALGTMKPIDARALLRRLDHSEDDPGASLERWSMHLARDRSDVAALVRVLLWRARAEQPADIQQTNDLLRIARAQDERGNGERGKTLLRLAAAQQPEKLGMRLDLGKRLINAGLVPEGAQLLVDGARELLDGGGALRALAPLRTVLDADSSHSAAHGLLLEAHAQTARRRRRRHTTAILLGVLVIVGGVALVQVRTEQRFEQRLAQVTDALGTPQRALEILERHFPKDDSTRILGLRASLQQQIREDAQRRREEWIERFEDVREQCEIGDPIEGLRGALELPTPPALEIELGPWPSRLDLYNLLAARLEGLASGLSLDESASPRDLRAEDLLAETLGRVLAVVEAATSEEASAPDEGLDSLAYRVNEILRELERKRAFRSQRLADIERRQSEREQDLTLAVARSYAQAGDYERATDTYERLLLDPDLDPDERAKLQELFGPEAAQVLAHRDAHRAAVQLAEAGDHRGARSVLGGHCEDLSELSLPWRIQTIPPDVRVEGAPEGTRLTPFVTHSPFGEPIRLVLEREGFVSRTIEVREPADLVVHMHREPELLWDTGHRVHAAPVASGRDHVVADRGGRIARLGQDGSPVWSRELNSLGGIARTPVFLHGRPGHLLVLTEDGDAWVIDAASGQGEGPWRAGVPPVEGPVTTRSGVSAQFADGRIAVWSDRPTPEVFEGEQLYLGPRAGRERDPQTAGLVLLRRSAENGSVLGSDWSDWSVEVHTGEYLVRKGGPDSPAFTVHRQGDWVYVAWEAPNALLKEGRLWVSDEGGLRAYLPTAEALHPGYP